jgi:hypothetical protein
VGLGTPARRLFKAASPKDEGLPASENSGVLDGELGKENLWLVASDLPWFFP